MIILIVFKTLIHSCSDSAHAPSSFSQTWVQVHLKVLKYFQSTLVAGLSTSTSTIAKNGTVLKYCGKYFKQYLSTSEVQNIV